MAAPEWAPAECPSTLALCTDAAARRPSASTLAEESAVLRPNISDAASLIGPEPNTLRCTPTPLTAEAWIETVVSSGLTKVGAA